MGDLYPSPGSHLRCDTAEARFGVFPKTAAEASKEMYGQRLKAEGYPAITTEILDAPPFYFAEDYHQQYLAKNPAGYCGLGGTGVSCPIGAGVSA